MNQFISGNLAMMINGPWQVPTMREQAADLNWNVALIPMDTQYASALGGENFAVIDNENVDASVDFLTWMTAPEQVATLNIGLGNIAPRSDVAETQFVGDAIMEKFVEQMQYAQAPLMPAGPKSPTRSLLPSIRRLSAPKPPKLPRLPRRPPLTASSNKGSISSKRIHVGAHERFACSDFLYERECVP